MEIYRTCKIERFNIRYIKRRQALRIGCQRRAFYIYFKKIASFFLWAAILGGTWFLFQAAKKYAFSERGYNAVGGEYLLLLLPFIVWVAWDTIKETFSVMKGVDKDEKNNRSE